VTAAIGELTPVVGVKAACEALGVPRLRFTGKRGWMVFLRSQPPRGLCRGRWIRPFSIPITIGARLTPSVFGMTHQSLKLFRKARQSFVSAIRWKCR
jgi:hypothetical protein